MAKVKHLFSLGLFLTFLGTIHAQVFTVRYTAADRQNAEVIRDLQDEFPSLSQAVAYINGLVRLMQGRGYMTSSLDAVAYDSISAEVTLFIGEQYRWANIETEPANAPVLEAIRFPHDGFNGAVDFASLAIWQRRILDHLEENGHPFGRVYFDSIRISGDQVSALLRIERGPVYHIDSIRLYGDARISNEFLQRYLQLPNGSLYNRKKLLSISRKLAELPYIEEEKPFDLSMLGTGSVLNLYLKNRRSSQVNALIGFLPNSNQLQGDKKLLLTVDANILLRNALGNGETIGLVWQQLQQKSPRLNLLFEQPFIFGSPFGGRFAFDMFRKDSSFLNINLHLGTTYMIGDQKTATVFLQRFQSIVNIINETQIIQSRRLPDEVDMRATNLGAGYGWNNTDYRFNPRKGYDFSITGSAGTKEIRRNAQIEDLRDPADPSFKFSSLYDSLRLKAYQLRIQTSIARYWPVGKQATFRTAVNLGIYESANFFRNELFMIGGNRLLRGFDEESQYVSRYAIGTVEYRYLLGRNSAFFVFADGGWGRHVMEQQMNHGYLGTGAGMAFETKAGIFNIVWALGSRDDTEFNLRQSKLHFGFVSYF